jgi:hypothetical protein
MPPKSTKKQNQKNTISLNGGIKMKKLTLIALLAMMLIGMLAFAACDTEEAEETVEETVEDVVAPVDSPAVADTVQQPATDVTP